MSNAKFVITTLQWQRRYCSSAFLGESRRVFFSIDYLIISKSSELLRIL